MQFRLVLLGTVLITVGVLAYWSVPNIHRTAFLTTQQVIGPEIIDVPSGRSVEIPRNVTLFEANRTEMLANITVTNESNSLSSLRFELFPKNDTEPCTNTNPKSFLVDQEVSNQSLKVALEARGVYCFVFINENSLDVKHALIDAKVTVSSQELRAERDGGVNLAGLGLGAIGFLIILYGGSRKTTIPWE